MVEPIIKYLKKGSVVWCPFDTDKSEFVLVLKEQGFDVIYSHINKGQDFLTYEPNEKYDYIIDLLPAPIHYIHAVYRLLSLPCAFALLHLATSSPMCPRRCLAIVT